MSKIRRILVPTDFSAYSAAALELALELVEALQARLLVMHVWDPPLAGTLETLVRIDGDIEERLSLRDHVRKMAEKRFGDFLSELEQRGLRGIDPRLVEGDPEERIVEASSGVDLVVMGSHGRARSVVSSSEAWPNGSHGARTAQCSSPARRHGLREVCARDQPLERCHRRGLRNHVGRHRHRGHVHPSRKSCA